MKKPIEFLRENFFFPSRPQFYQVIAHTSYVMLSLFYIFGLQRTVIQWLSLVSLTFALDLLLLSLRRGENSKIKFPITGIAPGGTIFLNMEAHELWPYLFAGTIAVLSKHIFAANDRHVFNPGSFGLFAAIMLFPAHAAPLWDLWPASPYATAFVFCLGSFVAWSARRLTLAYSYMFFLTLFSFLLIKLGHGASPLFGIMHLDMPPLYWAASLFSIPSMIFTFHLITDPMTSPRSPSLQIAHAAAIAAIDLALRFSHVLTAPFIANLTLCLVYFLARQYLWPRAENFTRDGINAPAAAL